MAKKRAFLLKNKYSILLYSTFLSCLAIISIYFALVSIFGHLEIRDNIYLLYLDVFIWLVFTADYLTRFSLAKNKLTFAKENIWDSLALIPVPLLNIYYSARIIDFLRSLRAIAFIDELRDGFVIISKYKEVAYAFYLFALAVIGASFGIYFSEKSVGTVSSVGDAFWWSIVTATTVGYGDISPKTITGRVIATMLMVSGLCLLSILTASMSNIIKDISNKYALDDDCSDNNPLAVDSITIDTTGLNEHEIRSIHKFVKHLKEND